MLLKSWSPCNLLSHVALLYPLSHAATTGVTLAHFVYNDGENLENKAIGGYQDGLERLVGQFCEDSEHLRQQSVLTHFLLICIIIPLVIM